MIAQINAIMSRDENSVDSALLCINVCRDVMQNLREYTQIHGLATKDEEIFFFKRIKPKFHSRLIFHLKVYHIEINRPMGSKMILHKYLSREFYKLKLYFDSHTSFYHYYRSGETFLDEDYFMRQGLKSKKNVHFIHVDADPSFSTIYDYQVARILANEMLANYLNVALSQLEGTNTIQSTPVRPVLAWSGSKVALAELVYALHASGLFNNSQADIKTISEYLGGIFNINIGNIYKVFEEIRLRKKNRTVFLDSLRQNLIQRMERDDDQAF